MEEKIKEIIMEALCVNEDEISDNVTFDELGADSLNIIEIVSMIEDEFEIEIEFEEFSAIETYGQMVSVLRDKLAA